MKGMLQCKWTNRYDLNPLIAEATEISDDDESVVDPNDDLDSQEGWSSEKIAIN